MAWISGVGLTPYGRHEGRSTLDLMSAATTAALVDAGLERADIDGVLCGYATTMPHLMLATVFAEHYGLSPSYAHAIQMGGATGFGMAMLAHYLVESGAAQRVLVVAGENRLTGQSRDDAMQVLAQVGHPEHELPFGATIPAYYALIASWYLAHHGASRADLAELAVLMRRRAADHPDAQYREPISVDDVLASRPIAEPLTLLDCCPVSDGAAAFVVARDPGPHGVRIRGCGQAHRHQHVTLASFDRFGASDSARVAFDRAGVGRDDIEYLALYDSFTITFAVLLEELGFAPPGRAGACARDGHFDPGGRWPLNTHGGLLSYGHCGVGGALAHLVEAYRQMTGRAGTRQLGRIPRLALLHGDGGVLSSHVSLVLERT